MLKVFKKEEGRERIFSSYNKLLVQWGTPFEEQDLDTPYGVTHVILCGQQDNPPLVLFHGVGDNSALMWIYNIQELAKHYYVVAVDTVGGPGKSQPNEAYFRSFDRNRWILAVLGALELERVLLAGVSNGAYIAAVFTAAHPERVLRTVCMAGGIRVSFVRMLLAFLPEALWPTESSARRLLRKLSAPGSDAFTRNPEVLQHWSYLLRYFNNRTMMVHRYVPFTESDLATIRNKTLFLIGRYDRLAHYPKGLTMLQQNEMRYMIVDQAGHGINHEQPERINGELIRFFSEAVCG